MADLENKQSKNTKKKVVFIKQNTRVDLTPMVDLGFLLITFFVFTTTLTTPTVMNLNMPFDKVKPTDMIRESCALTIMLSKNNIIKYYEGMGENNPLIKETFFGNDGIRKIILLKRIAVKKIFGSSEDFVMIIKPSSESTFQNFVDIVDEVAINNVQHYYTSELDAQEEHKLFSIKK